MSLNKSEKIHATWLLMTTAVFLLGATGLSAEEPVLKPRTVRRQKVGDVKQSIGTEFEKMLTLSTSLIASLSEQIEVVVKKIKALVSSNDTFFATKKAAHLDVYKKRLEKMRYDLEQTVAKIQKELKDLDKNFET